MWKLTQLTQVNWRGTAAEGLMNDEEAVKSLVRIRKQLKAQFN